MKRKLAVILCWALWTPSVFGMGDDLFGRCSWVVRHGGGEPITVTTRRAIHESGGLTALRNVFFKNLGEFAEAPRPGMEKAYREISLIDYISPTLLSLFPGAVRLGVLKRDDSEIGLLVEYSTETPTIDPSLFPYPNGVKTPNVLLFPIYGLLDETTVDAIRYKIFRAALEAEGSPYRAFQGNYVDYPILNHLVHWRGPVGLERILGKDFQIPALGPVFLPANHYSAAVVNHVLERKLDRVSDRRVLVMGAGGGGDSIALAKLGFQVTATDIDPFSRPTIALAANLAGVSDRVKIVQGHLYEKTPGKFPLVVFVAPYPSFDEEQIRDWRTYDRGRALLRDFYQWLPYHLTHSGSLILMSVEKRYRQEVIPSFLTAENIRPFWVRLPGIEIEYATYQMKLSRSGRRICSD
jgi:SAM-dependent methyltransferase